MLPQISFPAVHPELDIILLSDTVSTFGTKAGTNAGAGHWQDPLTKAEPVGVIYTGA